MRPDPRPAAGRVRQRAEFRLRTRQLAELQRPRFHFRTPGRRLGAGQDARKQRDDPRAPRRKGIGHGNRELQRPGLRIPGTQGRRHEQSAPALVQHDQTAQPGQVPAVAERPFDHEHPPGRVDVPDLQRLLPQGHAEHPILALPDEVVQALAVHAVAPDRSPKRPQGTLHQRTPLLGAAFAPGDDRIERVVLLDPAGPVRPERKQEHAGRRDRHVLFADVGDERVRGILLCRAGFQYGQQPLGDARGRQRARLYPGKRRSLRGRPRNAEQFHRRKRRVPERHLPRLHAREQTELQRRGDQVELAVNEVRHARGHTATGRQGQGHSLVGDGPPARESGPRPCRIPAGKRVQAARNPVPARPQQRGAHASTSTARPISSVSEMSGKTMNTRFPMRMRSLGFRPDRLTAQYGSSPAMRVSLFSQT